MPRRRALPWIVGGGILTVLIVMAVSFTRGPRPGGAEAEADAKPAIATVLDEAKPPEVAPSPVATVLDEAKPPDAAPPPEATEPDPTIAWRDAPLPSASEDPDAPILLVQLHSLERLFADLKAVGGVAGLSKPINDLLALLAVNGGAGGLPGIPAKKAWGAYVNFPPGANAPAIVGLVPVSDEAEFLKLLASLSCPADRDDTGLYIVRPRQLPAPVRFRIADGYAYGTFGDPAVLDDGRRIAPARLFPPRIFGDLVVTARADRVPAPIWAAILGQIRSAPTSCAASWQE